MDLTGWTPIRIVWHEGRPVVEWCHTQGVFFTDPFFGETVEWCLRHPFRLLFRARTAVEEVGRFVAEHPGVPPAGFIFHLSRCGSTLVSQMLAAVPDHLVLSEPAPVDAVLRAGQASDDDRITWLRSIVGALGQARRGERWLFVKFDAWLAHQLPLVRRAFPEVPWVFLFRDPVEVLVSHSRRLGAHMIPGALAPEPAPECSLVEYGARALAGICDAALAHAHDPLATFVEYPRLPRFVLTDLLPGWGVDVGEADVERMRRAATRDAHNPAIAFEPRPGGATAEIEAAAAQWLAARYRQLQEAAARGVATRVR